METTFYDYDRCLDALKEITPRSDPKHLTLYDEEVHFADLFNSLKRRSQEVIVDLCNLGQLPLPGEPSRWASYRYANLIDYSSPLIT